MIVLQQSLKKPGLSLKSKQVMQNTAAAAATTSCRKCTIIFHWINKMATE